MHKQDKILEAMDSNSIWTGLRKFSENVNGDMRGAVFEFWREDVWLSHPTKYYLWSILAQKFSERRRNLAPSP